MTGGTPGLDGVFGWLWRSSAQAVVVVGLVWLVQRLLGDRLSPAWRHRLWLLVVLRLIVPVTPGSDWSVFNLFPTRLSGGPALASLEADRPIAAALAVAGRADPMVPDASPRSRPAATGAEAPRQDPSGALAQEAGKSAPRPALASAAEPGGLASRVGATPGVAAHLERWALVVWGIGVAWLAVRLGVQVAGFRARFAQDRAPGSERLRELADEVRGILGLRAEVPVWETGQVRSPAVYGWARPCLLLPRGLAGALSATELRHVLLHELAHVRRHDLLWNWAVTGVEVLHWFNPVVRYAFRRLRIDRELATDALVLEAAGEGEARAYGETILRLLEALTTPSAPSPVLGIAEDLGTVRDRIRMIARFRRPSRWSSLAAIPVLALAMVALTDAQSDRPLTEDPGRVRADLAPGGWVPVDLADHVVTAWRGIPLGTPWGAVPRGNTTFNEVPFLTAGLVELAGSSEGELRELPTRTDPIRLQRRLAALHLVHGTGRPAAEGTPVAKVVWHYANGQSRESLLRYGEHVRYWRLDPAGEREFVTDTQTRIGWTGWAREGGARQGVLRLYHTRLANPLPDQVVDSIDVVSSMGPAPEVLVGLTAETPGTAVPALFAASGTSPEAGPKFSPLPLRAHCTRTFEVIDQDPDSSWAYAPHGRHVFNGVPFDLPGVLEVSGLRAAREDNPLPTSIRGIPLSGRAHRLHLLHGAGENLPDDTPLANLVVRYVDGRECVFPLVYGRNVRNWYKGGDKRDQVTDPNTRLGWQGDSPRSRRFGASLRIYHTILELPHPDAELRSLDLVSLMSESVSVVAGITLEEGNGGAGGAPPGAPELAGRATEEVRVRVVDPTTGRGIAGARVRLRVSGPNGEFRFGEQKVDARGETVLDVWREGSATPAVLARASGYVAAERVLPGLPLSTVLEVPLQTGVRIGGRILDAQGRPVAGARVEIGGVISDALGRATAAPLDTVESGDDGRWTSASAPARPQGLVVRVTHPAHVPGEFAQVDEETGEPTVLTAARLLEGRADLRLLSAVNVRGRVRGPGGVPVANADVVVATGPDFVNRRFARTGADGRFVHPVPELGAARVLVQGAGFAPQLADLELRGGVAPVDLDIALEPARRLRGRVLDEAGRPVAGAWVYVAHWRSCRLLTWRGETDAAGRFTWDGAPREDFLLVADKEGFGTEGTWVPIAPAEDGPVSEDLELRLFRGFVLAGSAVDAETRAPVEGVTVLQSISVEPNAAVVTWRPVEPARLADGRFTVTLNRPPGPTSGYVQFMVSAPGRQSVVSPIFDLRKPRAAFEFLLAKRKPRGAGPVDNLNP